MGRYSGSLRESKRVDWTLRASDWAYAAWTYLVYVFWAVLTLWTWGGAFYLLYLGFKSVSADP